MNKPSKREGFVDADPVPASEPESGGDPIQQTAAAEAAEWPVKVRLLHRGVRNSKNELVNELIFREPTGGDINRYGNPVRINQEGDVVIDERKMTTMLAVLSGILQPFIETMDPRDWNSCAYRLRGFFLPDPSAW
jgi:hypothetical protein